MKTTKSIGTVGLVVALLSAIILSGCLDSGTEKTSSVVEFDSLEFGTSVINIYMDVYYSSKRHLDSDKYSMILEGPEETKESFIYGSRSFGEEKPRERFDFGYNIEPGVYKLKIENPNRTRILKEIEFEGAKMDISSIDVNTFGRENIDINFTVNNSGDAPALVTVLGSYDGEVGRVELERQHGYPEVPIGSTTYSIQKWGLDNPEFSSGGHTLTFYLLDPSTVPTELRQNLSSDAEEILERGEVVAKKSKNFEVE